MLSSVRLLDTETPEPLVGDSVAATVTEDVKLEFVAYSNWTVADSTDVSVPFSVAAEAVTDEAGETVALGFVIVDKIEPSVVCPPAVADAL